MPAAASVRFAAAVCRCGRYSRSTVARIDLDRLARVYFRRRASDVNRAPLWVAPLLAVNRINALQR